MAKLEEYSSGMQMKLMNGVSMMVLQGYDFDRISFDLNIPVKLAVECWQRVKEDELI